MLCPVPRQDRLSERRHFHARRASYSHAHVGVAVQAAGAEMGLLHAWVTGRVGWSGRLSIRVDHDDFEFDRGQSAEGGLASAAVVGALDPGNDREPQLVARRPSLTVEHVLLEQSEERFHRRVVTG